MSGELKIVDRLKEIIERELKLTEERISKARIENLSRKGRLRYEEFLEYAMQTNFLKGKLEAYQNMNDSLDFVDIKNKLEEKR